MYKIAVLGDRDSIYGFAALGLEIFPVQDKEAGPAPCGSWPTRATG